MNKYQILKHYFGYDSFRNAQETLIDSILSGRDTLGIMPTGAGKSLCYQIPALLMNGITLVISPLISLMIDQVKALNQSGIHAAYLNSALTANQYFKALEYAKQGRYPIIYVAPERLLTDSFLDFALHAKIAMVAVDEAHCVSQWGQDFRPSYLKIMEFVDKLPYRPVISAFTATATETVKQDIIDILRLDDPLAITTGFDRDNLYFAVKTPKDRYGAIRDYIAEHPGESGIIYCLTRKHVEEVCERLIKEGLSVTRYHAGLSDEERKKNQEDFIYDRVPIVVATNAFGLGINKSNVRFVLHYGMPKNVESYYQEAGRAGRDGEPSECILYYSGQDVITNQFFIHHDRDNEELDPETLELILQRDQERLKKMVFYCTTNECLREYILRYFGEYGSNYCGNCSNCQTQFEEVDVTSIARDMIGCVESSGQRYGTTVILDTLRGAKTAKIRSYGMDENPYYAVSVKVPAHQMRQVLNQLQMDGYLVVSGDRYAIVKLTEKAYALLKGHQKLMMKMAKAKEETAVRATRKKRGGGAGISGAVDDSLFGKLRKLRMEIAKEEHVPPYIVFSDKTLADMALKKPKNKKEMLAVSGVGEVKYQKYGKRFLECLKNHLL